MSKSRRKLPPTYCSSIFFRINAYSSPIHVILVVRVLTNNEQIYSFFINNYVYYTGRVPTTDTFIPVLWSFPFVLFPAHLLLRFIVYQSIYLPYPKTSHSLCAVFFPAPAQSLGRVFVFFLNISHRPNYYCLFFVLFLSVGSSIMTQFWAIPNPLCCLGRRVALPTSFEKTELLWHPLVVSGSTIGS